MPTAAETQMVPSYVWTWTILVRIALQGAIFLILPRIGRRGLLFGSYVGEETSVGPEARRITRSWYAGMLPWFAACVAFSLGAAWAGRPWLGTAGSALLPGAGFLFFYLRAHYRARALAPAQSPPTAAAPVTGAPPPNLALPTVTTALCLAMGFLVAGYAWSRYAALPDRFPTHFGTRGEAEALSSPQLPLLVLMPLLTLVVGAGMGMASFLVAHAKRAIRHPDGGVSLAAQLRFREAVTRFLCGMALLATGLMAVVSIITVGATTGRGLRLLPPLVAMGIVMVVYALAGMLYIALRYGQGGSRLERSVAGAPLTNGLADNRCWYLGLIYFNRDDPSLLVEHRFGFGYTINLGNWKAVALLGGFLALFLGLFAVLFLVVG